jgi:epoxyqueuosine reductase
VRAAVVETLARECGFELAGVAPALPPEPEAAQFLDWVSRGLAGRMSYLTDHRAQIRTDPRNLLASAKSIVCVARSYNMPEPGPVARYARTEDYHDVFRQDLERLAGRMREEFGDFEYRICVDTAPLLERSYARAAGLGWIGRNTCLINQEFGSYVLLAELLTSLDLPAGTSAPDRCGTCTRCIDACPTDAIVPGGLRTELDSTRCISYFTIELKGEIPEEHRAGIGTLAFGCDICQEVCPWNRKAPFTGVTASSPELETLAALTPEQFRDAFRRTPVWRSKYSGLLRNVAVAMGNSRDAKYRPTLKRLAASEDKVVRSHAEWALRQID